MIYLSTVSRIQATARRWDPNDGYTVVWVLGLESRMRLEPRYHYITVPGGAPDASRAQKKKAVGSSILFSNSYY